jgi:hypothetical protein
MSFGRFMGGALMAIGGLLTVLCGGCTLFFVAQGLTSGRSGGQDLGGLVVFFAVVVGALGYVPGVIMLIVGRLLWGRSPAPTPPPAPGAPG